MANTEINEIYIGGRFKNIKDPKGIVVDASQVSFSDEENLKSVIDAVTLKNSEIEEALKTISTAKREIKDFLYADFNSGDSLKSGVYRITDSHEMSHSKNNPEGSDEYGVLIVDDFSNNDKTLIRQVWECEKGIYLRYIFEVSDNIASDFSEWKEIKEIDESQFAKNDRIETIETDIELLKNASQKTYGGIADIEADLPNLELGTIVSCLTGSNESFKEEYNVYIVCLNSENKKVVKLVSGGGELILPELTINEVYLNGKQVSDISKKIECNSGDELRIMYNFSSQENSDILSTVSYNLGSLRGTVGRVYPDGETNYSWTYKIPEVPSAVHTLNIYGTVYKTQSKKASLSLSIGALSIDSDFDENIILETNKDITIITKIDFAEISEDGITSYVFFDDVELELSEADKIVTSKEKTFTIPADLVTPGIHDIKIYLKNKKSTDGPDSNVMEFTVVAAKPGIVYAIPNSKILEASAGERLTASIRTIQLGMEKSKYPTLVRIFRNNDIVKEMSYTLDFGINLIAINDLQYTTNDNPDVSEGSREYTKYIAEFTVKSEDETAETAVTTVEVRIFKNNYNIAPVASGLLCWFSADGKSNQSEDYNEWIDKSTNNVKATLNNFNWSTNGWQEVQDGEDSLATALVLNSGSYVELDISPFENDIGKDGGLDAITISIDFETENILNPEAKVASCLYEYEGEDESAYYLRDALNEFVKASENDTYSDTEIQYETKGDGVIRYLSTNNVLNFFRYAGGYCWVDGKTYPNEEWPAGLRKADGDLPYETTTSSNASDRAINYNLGEPNSNYNIDDPEKPIDYKKFNGLNREAVIKQVGFYVDTENVVLSNTASPAKIEDKFHLNFSENTRTRIDLIITRSTSAPYYFSSMIGYVNGTLSLMKQINTSDSFGQNPNSGKRYKIYLGGKMEYEKETNTDLGITDIGSSKIYDFKIYNRALTPDEILRNYAANISNPQEKMDIIDNNGILNPETIAKIPQITFIGAKYSPTDGENNTTINSFIMQLSNDSGMAVGDLKKIKEPAYVEFNDPINNQQWSLKETGNLQIPIRLQFQGTSSMVYPVKNFKFKCYDSFELDPTERKASYGEKVKFNLGNGIEEQTFCLKVDFMDSSHCNNTGSANFIADYNLNATGPTPASEIDSRIRTTIYGFPVLIYYKTSLQDQTPKFIGVGNLNLDKSCTTSFGLKDSIKDQDSVKYDFGRAYFIDDEETKDILIKSEYSDIDGLTEGDTDFPMIINWEPVLGTRYFKGEEFVAVRYGDKYYKVQRILEFDEENEKSVLSDDKYEIALENPNSGHIVATLTEKNTLRSLEGWEISNVSCSEYKANSGKEGAGGFGNYGIESVAADIELRQPDDGDLEEINYAAYVAVVGEENAIGYREFKNPYYYHIQRMIKWVSKNSPHNTPSKAGFVNGLDSHFNRNYLMDYYLTISTLGGVDSLGKNLMVGTWGPENKLYETTEDVTLDESDPLYDPLAFKYTLSNGEEKWLTPKITKIKSGDSDDYKYVFAYDVVKVPDTEDRTVEMQLFYDEKCYDRWTKKFKEGHDKFVVTRRPSEVIWYPMFYDIDTICGLDNSGQLIYDVDIEIGDKLSDGTAVFNTDDSHLWLSVKEFLGDEDASGISMLSERWNTLRDIRHPKAGLDSVGDTLFSEKNLIGRFYYDGQISKIPATYYNQDCFIKYIYEGPNPRAGSGSYLYCIHGSRYEQIKRWYSQRIYYLDTLFSRGFGTTNSSLRFNHDRCDSLYDTSDINYYSDLVALAASKPDNYVYDPLTNKLTTKSGAEILPISFNFKTYQPGYVGLKWSNTGIILRKRVKRGETVSIVGNVPTSGDAEVFIFGGDNIKDIGEMFEYNVKQVDFRNLTKLSRLILGSDSTSCVINKLDLGANNTYLSELDLRGCSKLTSINVAPCINLRNIRMEKSAISSIELPNGGALEEIHYSSVIDTIELRNFINLKNITVPTLSNTTQIKIENCPNITGYIAKDGTVVRNSKIWKLLQQTENAKAINTIEVESYGICDPIEKSDGDVYLFLDKFYSFNTSKTIRGELVYTGSAIPKNYTKFDSAYPDLNIIYSNVTDASEMFSNYKNINCIGETNVQTGVDEYNRPTTTNIKYWIDNGEYDNSRWYGADGKPSLNRKVEEVYTKNTEFYHDTKTGKYYRVLKTYDDIDLDHVRKEIKESVQNFTKFTNIKGMFRDLSILDYLDPDTFKGIDLSEIEDGGADEVFEGCTNLRYFEVPSDISTTNDAGETEVKNIGLKVIGSRMFYGCKKARVFIKKSLDNKKISIDTTAFEYIAHDPNSEIQDRSVTIERPVLFLQHSAEDILLKTDEEKYIGSIGNEITNQPSPNGGYFKINDFGERIFNHNNNLITIKNTKWLREVYFDIEKLVINELIDNENFKISYAENNKGEKIICKATPLAGSLEFNDMVNSLKIKSLTCGALSELESEEISIPIPNYDNLNPEFGKISIEKSLLSILLENTNFGFDNIGKFAPSKLIQINIVDGSEIPERFLYNFANITKVLISDKIRTIGMSAFEGATSLTTVGYLEQNGVENLYPMENTQISIINDRAFYNCSSLGVFYMGNSIQHLGISIFENCTNLTSIGYSTSLKSVPERCFCECKNLQSVSGFSNEIELFDRECFRGCISLQLIKFNNNVNEQNEIIMDVIAFDKNDTTKGFNYFTSDSLRIEDGAFTNVGGLIRDTNRDKDEDPIVINKLVLTSNIKYIGTDAFSQSNEIVKNYQEEDVTEFVWEVVGDSDFTELYIGDRAFYNIRPAHTEFINGSEELLKSVLYMPKVKYLGSQAFYSQQNLEGFDLCLMKNSYDEIGNKWINNSKKIIYNYIGITDVTTNGIYETGKVYEGSEIKGRYILADTDAYLLRATASEKTNTGNILIRSSISADGVEYRIKEILSNAFDNLSSVKQLIFDKDSTIELIERNVLKSTSMIDIGMFDYDTGIFNGSSIPTSLVIETENNLKDTAWFRNMDTDIGFITLGRYLIGKNETDLEKSEKYTLDLRDESITNCDTIYDSAFEGANCNKVIFNDNIKYIYTNAFRNSSLDYSDEIVDMIKIDNDVDNKLYYIGENGILIDFEMNPEKVFQLPSNIEIIRKDAFTGCKFRKLFFPASLKEVDQGSFKQNDSQTGEIGILEHIEFADGCQLTGKDPFSVQTEYKLNIEPRSINATLKRLIIPSSMPGYFSANNLSYRQFSQVTELYLGNIIRDDITGRAVKIENIPLYLDGDGKVVLENTGTIYTNDSSDQIFDYKFYRNAISGMTGSEGMHLETTEKYSYCPYGDDKESDKIGYHSDNIIDIAYIRDYDEMNQNDTGLEQAITGVEYSIGFNSMNMDNLLALFVGFSSRRETVSIRQSQYIYVRTNSFLNQRRNIDFGTALAG